MTKKTEKMGACIDRLTRERDEARGLAESANAWHQILKDKADTHNRNGDMGGDGVSGIFEMIADPLAVYPWEKNKKKRAKP